MHKDRVRVHVLCVLVGLVAALWLYPWLNDHRYQRLTTSPATEFVVTNPANNGPGTLREALFRAIRSDVPTVVVLRTNDMVVTTPLPPLVTRTSIRIRSEGEPRTIRVAPSLATAVFDVRAGRLDLENVAIRGAAAGYAVSTVSEERVTLRQVTVAESDVGVHAAGVFELEIADSTFDHNRIGVETVGSGAALVDKTTFRSHEEAAIWAIGAADQPFDTGAIIATANLIEGGRFGIVLGNLRARLHENEIRGFRGDGIIAIGGTLEITGNRLWNGRGAAIRSIGMRNGLIEGNDIHELGAMGILVQAANAAIVTDNRVYRNGYGIVTVLNDNPASVQLRNNLVLAQDIDGLAVFGDSPLIADNRAMRNGAAGIRIFHLVMGSSYRVASPLLKDNVLEQNGYDEPVVSEYVLRSAAE
jgi:parallel beta helix pectate lyase-like protein